MTLEIALVLGILVIALILFFTEWVRMHLVALLVLSSFASPVAPRPTCS